MSNMVIEIDKDLAIKACEMYNYNYSVITPNDIVIPPAVDDNISEDQMEKLSVNW